jgi:capsular polysaccharide biosynthesis protein
MGLSEEEITTRGDSKMSTHRIIAPFWRRRWLILTTTLTVIIGTLLWARGLPTIYEASLTLTANSKDGTTIPPGQLARIREELWSSAVIYPIVESNLFETQRAAGVSNDALVDQLQRSINLTEHSHGDSGVIHLRYFDPKPERAEAIASVLGQTIQMTEAKNTAEGKVGFRIDKPARRASSSLNPRLQILAVFALGGGILFGLVLASLSELVSSWRHRRQPELNLPIV